MRLLPFSLHFNKKCISEDNSKKQAPGGGDPCSSLPSTLIVNIINCIRILELRRLHRGKVSPHFPAAIKRTLGEIALKCQEAILKADRSGDKETVAYKQSYKACDLLSNVPEWQVETAYSAPDCCWRDKPLSSSSLDKATGWNYGDAELVIWIEGGGRFQLGITANPWESAWDPVTSEEEQGSEAHLQQ
jgi:hypothetical protein